MAKLYAEITSDKGGRVVGKGGNSHIRVVLFDKNDGRGSYEVIFRGNKPPEVITYERT